MRRDPTDTDYWEYAIYINLSDSSPGVVGWSSGLPTGVAGKSTPSDQS